MFKPMTDDAISRADRGISKMSPTDQPIARMILTARVAGGHMRVGDPMVNREVVLSMLTAMGTIAADMLRAFNK